MAGGGEYGDRKDERIRCALSQGQRPPPGLGNPMCEVMTVWLMARGRLPTAPAELAAGLRDTTRAETAHEIDANAPMVWAFPRHGIHIAVEVLDGAPRPSAPASGTPPWSSAARRHGRVRKPYTPPRSPGSSTLPLTTLSLLPLLAAGYSRDSGGSRYPARVPSVPQPWWTRHGDRSAGGVLPLLERGGSAALPVSCGDAPTPSCAAAPGGLGPPERGAPQPVSHPLQACLPSLSDPQCNAVGLRCQGEAPSGGGAAPGTGAPRGPRRVCHGSQDVDATADEVRCAPWTAQQVPSWQVVA